MARAIDPVRAENLPLPEGAPRAPQPRREWRAAAGKTDGRREQTRPASFYRRDPGRRLRVTPERGLSLFRSRRRLLNHRRQLSLIACHQALGMAEAAGALAVGADIED